MEGQRAKTELPLRIAVKKDSHNRSRKSRGTESKDAENLAEIQHILLKALKDLK